MVRLITNTGREIRCEAVLRSAQFNYLYIHTAALTRTEIDTIFGDPEETAVLTAIEQTEVPTEEGTITVENTRVHRGWTQLDAVMRSPVYDNPDELMIFLARPESD